ncbi:MAG: hypothetical protein IJO02_04665 [Clostridia bacterium]|nr:hypothetical protein [Clostridia bacterium]
MMNEKKCAITARGMLSDPVRALMTYDVCRKGQLLLGAVLMAVFYALVMKLGAAMDGVAVIAAVGVLGAAILTAFAWGALSGKQPMMVLLCLAAMSMLAVGAHLAMLDITPGRYPNLLKPMLDDMWNYELVTAMAWEDGSWSGVYLIVMALVSRLESFSQLYALKLFDMICQCLAAGAVLRLALLRGAKTTGAMAAMFCAVLAPTMLMNAGVWAQCDATFAMLTLWGLVLLLGGRPMLGCVLWGAALGTKLQSAFLFPLLIVLFMENRVQLRHLLALILAAFLSQIAIVLDGQGVMSMITRYALQLDDARWGTVGLADCAPGVYGLMRIASVREFSGMGLYFGIACALLTVMALLRSRKPLTNDTLMMAALLLACGLPLVLPQMNARSLYLAIMLAFACAGNARRVMAAGLLEFVSICSHMLAIFGGEVIPMIPMSLLAIGAAVLVLLELLPLIGAGRRGEAQEA